MNQKATPILIGIVVVLGAIAYFSTSSGRGGAGGRSLATRVLPVERESMMEVRVERDYHNSFTLGREFDGTWSLTQPSGEPAAAGPVESLISTLIDLRPDTTIDTPIDDRQRYGEYGLFEPKARIAVYDMNGEHVLLLGRETTDGRGFYCTVAGRDDIYVISMQAARILLTDLEGIRQPSSDVLAAAQAGTGTRLGIEDITVGSGAAAQIGQSVAVHYRGALEDGTQFDSSHDRGAPFRFTLGQGQVIQGWEQGLVGMRMGGKRNLTIPPELGYGTQGSPPNIPPNATLLFEVELLELGAADASGVVVSTRPVGASNGELGSFITVAVRVDGNEGRRIGTYAFDVSFPHEYLVYEGIRDGGEGFLQAPQDEVLRDGQIAFSGVSALSAFINGQMCILEFRVTQVRPEGYDIRLVPRGGTPLVDTDFQPVPHTIDTSQTMGLLRRM